MNRKGFTLIELLAVLVILSLIMTVTVTSVISIYKGSKDKSEEAFKKVLTSSIEDYITLHYLDFNDKSTFKLKALEDEGIITEKDLINPKNKGTSKAECNINEEVTINNKESYCFKVDLSNSCGISLNTCDNNSDIHTIG